LEREEKKHRKNSPRNPVTALILFAAAYTINFFSGAGLIILLFYSLGSLFYVIYIKINSIGYRYDSDYIQTGEASAALLAIIAASSWLSGNLFLLFPAVILIVLLSDIFFNRVLIKKGSEAFTAGIYINIFSAALLAFSTYKIPGFDRELIVKVLFGYITTMTPEPLFLITSSALALLSALLYFTLKPELVLFSHGPTYFRSARMDYTCLRVIVTLLRSIVFSAAFLLAGIAGGAALYFHRPGKGVLYQFEFIMITLTYTQVVLMVSLLSGREPAALLSIATSYIVYLYLKRKRIYLYDRN
jgi:hypothetical protein